MGIYDVAKDDWESAERHHKIDSSVAAAQNFDTTGMVMRKTATPRKIKIIPNLSEMLNFEDSESGNVLDLNDVTQKINCFFIFVLPFPYVVIHWGILIQKNLIKKKFCFIKKF